MEKVYNVGESQARVEYTPQDCTCGVNTNLLDSILDTLDRDIVVVEENTTKSVHQDNPESIQQGNTESVPEETEFLVSDITTEIVIAPVAYIDNRREECEASLGENSMTVMDRTEEIESVSLARESTSDTVATLDRPDIEEVLSLKYVVNYCFYFDLSEENEKDIASRGAVVDDLDSNSSGFVEKDESEGSGGESGTVADVDSLSQRSGPGVTCSEDSQGDPDSDFDADIDSLCTREAEDGISHHLTSFSMMNIFDSASDDKYDFTGSLDFNMDNIGRYSVSASMDTLEWLSDSSEDILDRPCDTKYTITTSSTGDSDNTHCTTSGRENCNKNSVSSCSEIGSSGTSDNLSEHMNLVCTAGQVDNKDNMTTKHYQGSTFTISSLNTEIRYKLIRRLFNKVFPMKKYVVNRKK